MPNAARGGAVAQYDLATRALLVNAPIREEGQAGSAGILALGSSAFISDRSDNAILVYDLDGPGVVRILGTDHDAPDGIAWSPIRVAPFGSNGAEINVVAEGFPWPVALDVGWPCSYYYALRCAQFTGAAGTSPRRGDAS